MRCPFCGHDDSQVKDSRPTEDGAAIRRRRQCEGCGARFTTFERIQLRELTVLKTEGRREPFEREKLERSVAVACRKRPIDQARIDKLVSGIQRQLETLGETEIEFAKIGEFVMEGLKAWIPSLISALPACTRNLPKPKTLRSSQVASPKQQRSERAADYHSRPATAGRKYR